MLVSLTGNGGKCYPGCVCKWSRSWALYVGLGILVLNVRADVIMHVCNSVTCMWVGGLGAGL